MHEDMQTDATGRAAEVGGRRLQQGGGAGVGERRLGRGRGSGCFMRPLTFTSPVFQSAVSIKDGCSSYVFPIHQRRRDVGPTDGQLHLMEGGRAEGRSE